MSEPSESDPVLVRRAQIANVIKIAQRVGYTLFALFMLLIIIGFLTPFPSAITLAAKACLILGPVVPPPPLSFPAIRHASFAFLLLLLAPAGGGPVCGIFARVPSLLRRGSGQGWSLRAAKSDALLDGPALSPQWTV